MSELVCKLLSRMLEGQKQSTEKDQDLRYYGHAPMYRCGDGLRREQTQDNLAQGEP
jgi:hypothetical protein